MGCCQLTVGSDASPGNALDARVHQLIKQCRVKGAVQDGVVVVAVHGWLWGCGLCVWGVGRGLKIYFGLSSCTGNHYRLAGTSLVSFSGCT